MNRMINFKTKIFHVPTGAEFKVPVDGSFEFSNIYGLFGINGIGKTTFLNQLIKEIQGKDELFDCSSLSSRRMAIIPQKIEDLLCPWLSPSKIQKVFSNNFASSSDVPFHGINKNISFRKLSGGEKQRFAIELVTSFDFDFLFLDEPFSSLDLENVEYCSELIKKYMRTHCCMVFIILHDLVSLQHLSDYILLFNQQKSRIYLEPNPSRANGDGSGKMKQDPNFVRLCYEKSF